MEQRALELQARRATVAAFGDLANAMCGVAAARTARARELIAGVDAYAATVQAAMAQARALLPQPAQDVGGTAAPAAASSLWVLVGGEQGFNGGFSERVLDAAPQALAGRVLVLGTQMLRLVRARGCTPEWSAPMVAHAAGAAAASDALHAALAQALHRRQATAVEIVGAELLDATGQGEQIVVQHRRLLPLAMPDAPGAAGPAPLLHLPPSQLLDELAFEYVAAQLARAVLHGHAADNLARLRAMTAAGENVERMVQGLEADERRLRQESITSEIIEFAAGLRG